jgi:hypothetical protein
MVAIGWPGRRAEMNWSTFILGSYKTAAWWLYAIFPLASSTSDFKTAGSSLV